VPLWISVTIPQHRELAVMGTQAYYLVHSNWPPVFSPLVLVRICTGRKEGRKAFQHRVNWPWKPIPPQKEDDEEVGLTSLSRASTARSGLEKGASSATNHT
jgi:hypothetical protein